MYPPSQIASPHTKASHDTIQQPWLPACLLAGAIAVIASIVHAVPGMTALNPMILSIVPLRSPASFSSACAGCIAIILLGFQLTLTQVIDVGGTGTVRRRDGLDRHLSVHRLARVALLRLMPSAPN